MAQASGTTLGFARGNVGFLAVGDLGKDFNTGLPVNMKTTMTLTKTLTITITIARIITITMYYSSY